MNPDIEHLAKILYCKLTAEEQYFPRENLALTSDRIFEDLCEIVA